MVSQDGFVKILDFGLAKLQGPLHGVPTPQDETSLTQVGLVIGTPDYMSPEQAADRAARLSLRPVLRRARLLRDADDAPALPPRDARPDAVGDHPGRAASARGPGLPRAAAAALGDRALPLEGSRRALRLDGGARARAQADPGQALRFPAVAERASRRVEPRTGRTPERRPPPPPHTRSPMPSLLSSRRPTRHSWRRRWSCRRRALTKVRRVRDFVLVLVLALALFGGGAFAGDWFREQADRRAAADLEGQPPGRTDDARDGAAHLARTEQTLAFLTLVSGRSQVAVMKHSSGDWTVLTKRADAGSRLQGLLVARRQTSSSSTASATCRAASSAFRRSAARSARCSRTRRGPRRCRTAACSSSSATPRVTSRSTASGPTPGALTPVGPAVVGGRRERGVCAPSPTERRPSSGDAWRLDGLRAPRLPPRHRDAARPRRSRRSFRSLPRSRSRRTASRSSPSSRSATSSRRSR